MSGEGNPVCHRVGSRLAKEYCGESILRTETVYAVIRSERWDAVWLACKVGMSPRPKRKAFIEFSHREGLRGFGHQWLPFTHFDRPHISLIGCHDFLTTNMKYRGTLSLTGVTRGEVIVSKFPYTMRTIFRMYRFTYIRPLCR